MTRFNFLGPVPRRSIVRARTIEPRLYVPLSALAATAILVAGICMVQLIRLHAAIERHDAAILRQNRSEASMRRIKAIAASVSRQAGIAAVVLDAQRSGMRRANELASIGNRLPADTWLTSIRFESGHYALEGFASRPASVGAAILSLRAATAAGGPELLSLSADPIVPARVRYAIHLDQARP